MELKLGSWIFTPLSAFSFNRTFMELKFLIFRLNRFEHKSFNRTFMELKLRMWLP